MKLCWGPRPARVHTACLDSMLCAVDCLCFLADGGRCQKSVESLMNVSSEHH